MAKRDKVTCVDNCPNVSCWLLESNRAESGTGTSTPSYSNAWFKRIVITHETTSNMHFHKRTNSSTWKISRVSISSSMHLSYDNLNKTSGYTYLNKRKLKAQPLVMTPQTVTRHKRLQNFQIRFSDSDNWPRCWGDWHVSHIHNLRMNIGGVSQKDKTIAVHMGMMKKPSSIF